MKAWFRAFVCLVALATLLGVNASTSTAQAAAAAPTVSCSGSGCNNTDPATTGCANNAYTVETQYITFNGQQIGKVELRWSPTCQTNWTRVTKLGGFYTYVYGTLQTTNGSVLTSYGAYGSQVYTNQWYAPNLLVQACGVLANGPNQDGRGVCTGAHAPTNNPQQADGTGP